MIKTKFELREQKTIVSISLILLLTMTVITAFAQPGLAQVGMSNPRPTKGYVSVAPTLVGVNQEATVTLWVFPIPITYAQQPVYQGYSGVTVSFTRPDGSVDSFKPVDGTGQFAPGQTESLGFLYFYYAPNMVGNWSVSFSMPEQNVTDSSGTVIYAACESMTGYFTVQTDPVDAGLINGYPWSQLPNDNTYWSYPINSNNREWYTISGDWLINGVARFTNIFGTTSNSWQPYGSGPNTGHIVWKDQIGTGGLVGGDYGSISYATVVYQGAIFTSGRAYFNVPSNAVGLGSTINKFKCIDLVTGEELFVASGQINCGWHTPGNALSQNFNNNSVVLGSSYGSTPQTYLVGAASDKWNLYDSATGTLMRTITDVAASAYILVDGTNFAYGITSDRTNLFGWDMAKVVNNNWTTGITWKSPILQQLPGPGILGISSDASTIVINGMSVGGNQYFGYSTKDGASRWNLTLSYNSGGAFSLFGEKADYFIVVDPVEAVLRCYSKLSGTLIWTSPSFSDSPWASEVAIYNSETNDDKNLYMMFPDGIIRALSLDTGKLVWESTPFASTEYINNVVPYYIGIAMQGGNIYAYAGYSTGYQLNPIPRHAMLVCVNATTGDTTYTLNGGLDPVSAANGYVIAWGQYDGYVYCVGKGKTATTVTAPTTVIPFGKEVLIQGFVKAMSPANPDTPAVSDEDMSEWMDYLHMQNATLLNNPPKPKGVDVALSVLDSNGNLREIGTTTSDHEGFYSFTWIPDIEGRYTIYASFAGTESYWPSSAVTGFAVESVESTPTPTQNPQTSMVDQYFVPAVAGIAVLIVACFAITLLLLRKRP